MKTIPATMAIITNTTRTAINILLPGDRGEEAESVGGLFMGGLTDGFGASACSQSSYMSPHTLTSSFEPSSSSFRNSNIFFTNTSTVIGLLILGLLDISAWKRRRNSTKWNIIVIGDLKDSCILSSSSLTPLGVSPGPDKFRTVDFLNVTLHLLLCSLSRGGLCDIHKAAKQKKRSKR